MSVLTVTEIPDELVAALRQRAEARGTTVEQEARDILCSAVPLSPGAIREKNEAIFAVLGACPDNGDWIPDRHSRHGSSLRRPTIELEE